MSVAYILFLRSPFLNVNLKTKSEIYREFLMTRLPFSFYFFCAYTIDEKLNIKKRFCDLHFLAASLPLTSLTYTSDHSLREMTKTFQGEWNDNTTIAA